MILTTNQLSLSNPNLFKQS